MLFQKSALYSAYNCVFTQLKDRRFYFFMQAISETEISFLYFLIKTQQAVYISMFAIFRYRNYM